MKELTEDFRRDFLENVLFRIDESTRMLAITFKYLEESELWKRPNAASNSIGNLILHLCGNITQYAISSLCSKPDIRDRDLEFATESGLTKRQLLDLLTETINKAKECIASCPVEELLRKREVQGFSLSGLGIVIHVVEHYSYHTGQIAYWTKLLKDKDLKFYEGTDLNIKNS